MKNPFYSLLTPIIVIGGTVLGFFLLKPAEPGMLFIPNFVFTIILEVLFFVWMRWGHIGSRCVDGQTSYFRIILGVWTLYYIIASFIWMVGFFLLATPAGRHILAVWFKAVNFVENLPEMSINIYYFGILVLTLIWILIASITGRHDAAYNTQQTALENATENVRNLVAELKAMADEHKTPETERQWKALIRDAESTPPARLAASEAALRGRAEKLIDNK